MEKIFAPPVTVQGPEAEPKDISVIEQYPEQGKIRLLDVALEVLPLPEDTMARRFIPSWDTMKSSVCWDEPTVQLVRDMAVRLAGGVPSRSEGPTGVSKSFAVEVLAALTNRSYLRHNYSKDSDPGDTVGRFVPSDHRLAVRFEEILADPDLTDGSRALIERARRENRSLTPYESRKVASNEGINGLEDDNQWRWQNGTLAGAMMYGSVYGADEPNLAPGNVVERENPTLEKRPKLRIVEHEGEVVRELSAEEQAIIDGGGVVPGVIGLDESFWYTAAQNPWGIGGGRIEESEARRNRLQDRIVEALTAKEYEDYLRFLIKGDQPDITWRGKHYKGEKNTPTEYRDLEAIPSLEVVLPWLAQFQTDLQELVENGQIGSEKDIKGGSYVYSRRNLERFLDSLKGAQNSLLDTQELTKGNLVYSTNWRDLFLEALHQEYLAGMYKEDVEVVKELIEAAGIEDQLGPSANNPTLPDWAISAQEQGVEVEVGAGEWILRRAGVELEQINVVRTDAKAEGYTLTETDDELILKRPLRGILELYVEKFPPKAVDPTENNNVRQED